MKTLVQKLTGQKSEGDPINIHVTIFWLTIVFWTIATSCFALAKAFN
ncbi:MAG: hypothetical protein ACXVC6_10085 [Bacteroidia bacterium]